MVDRRSWSRAPLAAAALGVLLCACSGAGATVAVRHGGTLKMSLYAPPASFNPLVAGDINSVRAYTPLFPHLYSVNADLSVSPDLATQLPRQSPDGTTWTIPIRVGAVWSDGKAISAADVVYTITTEADPTLDTQAAFDWSEVASAKATDAHTVTIVLHHPDASFLADHLATAIVPAHTLQETRPAQMSQSLFGQRPTVTGGPFTFESKLSAGAYVLAANPHYYLGRPNVDFMDEFVIADPAQLAGQLAQGQVLWAPGLTAAQAVDARAQAGVEVHSFPALGYYAVQFNDRPNHLFADAATRHALDAALDRPRLVHDSTGGLGTVLWGDISPASWAFNAAAIPAHPRDVGAARALLGGAGWTLPASGPATRGGTTLSAHLVYPRSDPARALAATAIAAQAAPSGIVLTPTALGDNDYAAAIASGSFEVALTAGGLGVDPDDSATLACTAVPSPTTPSGLNAGGFCDPALDALFTREQAVTGASWSALAAARGPIFEQVERTVAHDLPLIPLWTDTRWVAINVNIGGVGAIGPQLDEDLASAFYATWYLAA